MTRQRLRRPRKGKIIAGVCAGVADYFDLDVTLVRAAFVIFGLFGAGEIVYLVLWVIAPKGPA